LEKENTFPRDQNTVLLDRVKETNILTGRLQEMLTPLLSPSDRPPKTIDADQAGGAAGSPLQGWGLADPPRGVRYNGRMDYRRERHIGDILKDRNIILRNADAATRGGFTQVPNFLLKSKNLGAGDKLAFAMLMSYAWQKDYCYPGQKRLADDVGLHETNVRKHLKALEAAGCSAAPDVARAKPMSTRSISNRGSFRPDPDRAISLVSEIGSSGASVFARSSINETHSSYSKKGKRSPDK
jgi:hypothetical protein